MHHPITLAAGPECLPDYSKVPISFMVRSILEVELISGGLGGLLLRERPVESPYLYDYDREEAPTRWSRQFDLTNWGFFLAGDSQAPMGAATVAFDTPGVHMLEGRKELAVLWDIRVHPDARRQGVGAALFRAAVEWARERGCTQLKVETQTHNVGACQFYVRMGCHLGAIHRYAYAGDPATAGETMVLWYINL